MIDNFVLFALQFSELSASSLGLSLKFYDKFSAVKSRKAVKQKIQNNNSNQSDDIWDKISS